MGRSPVNHAESADHSLTLNKQLYYLLTFVYPTNFSRLTPG